jgi:hypothetical protein
LGSRIQVFNPKKVHKHSLEFKKETVNILQILMPSF